MLGADPGKERKTERKGEVQTGHQVALYCHHGPAHHIHPPQAPGQYHRRISEDLKIENTGENAT